jgi:hypothetical protein
VLQRDHLEQPPVRHQLLLLQDQVRTACDEPVLAQCRRAQLRWRACRGLRVWRCEAGARGVRRCEKPWDSTPQLKTAAACTCGRVWLPVTLVAEFDLVSHA